MPMAGVYNIKGEKVSTINLKDEIFNVEVKSHLLHDVVNMQLANKRAGTASTKGRSEVSGSTRKLWRQKGTGRARVGGIRSPIRRGGGVAFGPKPRDYGYKVPKKVRRQALKIALTTKRQDNKLIILDDFNLETIRTKDFVKVMSNLNIKNVLIVTHEKNTNLELSSRNVPGVKVLGHEGLNVYDILRYENLVLLESTIPKIEERLLS
ncbi:MAG TPA: 50S ribosomal protein L4 [Syntrophaceae bacterium]|nr:50S ribosomal protein L4 [Syntrophaceae bacterium]